MADYGYLHGLLVEVPSTVTDVTGHLLGLLVEVPVTLPTEVRVNILFAEVIHIPVTGPAYTEHFTAVDAVSDVEGGGSGWRRWS